MMISYVFLMVFATVCAKPTTNELVEDVPLDTLIKLMARSNNLWNGNYDESDYNMQKRNYWSDYGAKRGGAPWEQMLL